MMSRSDPKPLGDVSACVAAAAAVEVGRIEDARDPPSEGYAFAAFVAAVFLEDAVAYHER